MRTRIAPTPSGFLHAGNAFNFLVTAHLARELGAQVVLRIDDLDAERSRPEYVEDIFHSLEWLGIRVDEGPSGPVEFQARWSQRFRQGRYQQAIELLMERNALYPCSCSRSQLEGITRSDHSCRQDGSGSVPPNISWRLRIEEVSSVQMRELSGRSEQLDLSTLMPDPVIVQRDGGRPAYQIASVCDDLDMGVTFIVRGADLLPSTACQLQLGRVLGYDAFDDIRYHHHPLALGPDGQKLSKSAGSSSLKAMREGGGSASDLIMPATAYADGLLKSLSL